ncbi:MAG TPA: DUF308 domain-containing protein [Actinocrinis sp.]|nr:DUF308 domain-containing protein [Actinocrinis sp.]
MSEPLSGRIVDEGSGPRVPDPGPGAGPGGGPAPRWQRLWVVPVVFGTASVVLGLLVLFWPRHSINALTILFGLYLLITGAYRAITSVQLHGVDPLARAVALVLSALSIVVGLICLADPFNGASKFAVVAGAFWLASGAIMMLGARQRRAALGPGARGASMAGGGFAFVVGLLIVLFPGASLLFLAVVLGIWLLVVGLSALTAGLTARRLLKNVAHAALYWP